MQALACIVQQAKARRLALGRRAGGLTLEARSHAPALQRLARLTCRLPPRAIASGRQVGPSWQVGGVRAWRHAVRRVMQCRVEAQGGLHGVVACPSPLLLLVLAPHAQSTPWLLSAPWGLGRTQHPGPGWTLPRAPCGRRGSLHGGWRGAWSPGVAGRAARCVHSMPHPTPACVHVHLPCSWGGTPPPPPHLNSYRASGWPRPRPAHTATDISINPTLTLKLVQHQRLRRPREASHRRVLPDGAAQEGDHSVLAGLLGHQGCCRGRERSTD